MYLPHRAGRTIVAAMVDRGNAVRFGSFVFASIDARLWQPTVGSGSPVVGPGSQTTAPGMGWLLVVPGRDRPRLPPCVPVRLNAARCPPRGVRPFGPPEGKERDAEDDRSRGAIVPARDKIWYEARLRLVSVGVGLTPF